MRRFAVAISLRLPLAFSANKVTINLRSLRAIALAGVVAATSAWLTVAPLRAQDAGLQPGEAFVTRFSGITATTENGQQYFWIDAGGTVGSIIDVRGPGRPPTGTQWINEPQRNPVTAIETGQVFGVVLDDATPPNIYLSATSAFGLHLQHGTQQWMDGMWGTGGGPGTIYRLDAANNYRARPFAQVTLNNRQNTGAALGNMAFDRTNKQIFVSRPG
jgi:hypothetical protein